MTPVDLTVTRRRRERDCPAESWPHVLTAALQGGQPLNRLPLPRVMRPLPWWPVFVALGVVLWALA